MGTKTLTQRPCLAGGAIQTDIAAKWDENDILSADGRITRRELHLVGGLQAINPSSNGQEKSRKGMGPSKWVGPGEGAGLKEVETLRIQPGGSSDPGAPKRRQPWELSPTDLLKGTLDVLRAWERGQSHVSLYVEPKGPSCTSEH